MFLLLQFPHNTNEIFSTYLCTLALRTCTTQNFSHLQKKNVCHFSIHILLYITKMYFYYLIL